MDPSFAPKQLMLADTAEALSAADGCVITALPEPVFEQAKASETEVIV